MFKLEHLQACIQLMLGFKMYLVSSWQNHKSNEFAANT